MSATIGFSQNSLLEELLTAGRWRNKSEIIRHGLELVKREVESENLRPLTNKELSEAYAAMSDADRAEDAAMSQASVYPAPGEL